MNRKIALIAFAGTSSFAFSAGAQTVNSFALNDGLFRYSMTNLSGSTVRTGSLGGRADFGYAGTGTSVVLDRLWQSWWWYRAPTDTREFALSNQVAATQLSSRSVFLRYEEPAVAGGPSALRFDFTYTLNEFNATQSMVTVDYTVTNISSSAIQGLQFFNVTDYDVIRENWSNYTSLPSINYIRTWANNQAQEFATLGAEGVLNERWQISASGSVRGMLTNSTVDNLRNLSTVQTPGDVEGGLQWGFNLGAGASVQGRVLMGFNFVVPSPGAMALLGLGGLIAARRRRA